MHCNLNERKKRQYLWCFHSSRGRYGTVPVLLQPILCAEHFLEAYEISFISLTHYRWVKKFVPTMWSTFAQGVAGNSRKFPLTLRIKLFHNKTDPPKMPFSGTCSSSKSQYIPLNTILFFVHRNEISSHCIIESIVEFTNQYHCGAMNRLTGKLLI